MTKTSLQELLQRKLPHLLVRKLGATIQVRTSKITFQNIDVLYNEKANTARLRSTFDMLPVFIICFFPLAIYLYIHRTTYKAFKQEVALVLSKNGVTIL
ncbi:MAG: hypothetical protein MUF19_00375 [Candidatus Pacebacteria bacterium]|nr:hypothetical protein [Candidatus Paceibacterota bacterium]